MAKKRGKQKRSKAPPKPVVRPNFPPTLVIPRVAQVLFGDVGENIYGDGRITVIVEEERAKLPAIGD